MKRSLLTCLALLAMATVPVLGFEYWSDNFQKYEVGENLLESGYTVFGTYAGKPAIIELDGRKCLQLQKSEGGSTEYNMVLTPVIGPGWNDLAASNGMLPGNFDITVSGSVIPGSGVDLFALYGQSTNRYFYFNFNTNGDLATDPASAAFTVKKDGFNDISATLHYSDGTYHLVSVTVNEQSWSGDSACSSGDAPRFLRLSTQLSSLGDTAGAIFGGVALTMQGSDDKTFFKEDFNFLQDGTEVGNLPGYAFFNNYVGTSTVVSDWPGAEGKVMVLKESATGSRDYDMLLTPAFDMTPRNPGQQLTQIKARFAVGSETDLFAFYDKNMSRFFYLNSSASGGTMASSPAGISFTNLYTDGLTMNDMTLVWDALNSKFISITVNGETIDCNIAFSGIELPARLRLSTQLTSQALEDSGSAYESISIGTRNRSDEPELYCQEEAIIPLHETSATMDIYNAGPPTSPITFSVTKDAEWLTIDPMNGEFTESATLNLTAKEGLERGYYVANVKIDGGVAGEKEVKVIYHNGVIYFEDFNDLTPGPIEGQKGWGSDAGQTLVASVYDCDGYCAYTETWNGGYDGTSTYLPKPWYENIIVKVSCDIYIPSDTGASGMCLVMKESDSKEKFECGATPVADGFNLIYIQGTKGGAMVQQDITDFPPMPFDTWVNVEYTMDLQTQKLLSFGWDGVVTNFNNFSLENPSCNYYSSFGFSFYDPNGNARCALDNLKVEALEREDTPIPAVETYKFIGTNTVENIRLTNGGGGTFRFTAKPANEEDPITVSPASGLVRDVQNLAVTIDRSSLDPGYYRSFILIDCGDYGVFTNMVAYSVGNVYYEADFQAPFFQLGNFIGQDDWSSDYEGNIATIIETNGVQTLLVPIAGGWGGLMHPVQVPRETILKVEFDFLLPANVFTDVESDIVICLKQHDKYNPIYQMFLKKEIIDGVNYVYGQCDEDGSIEMPKIECSDEFLHCCYVYDLKESRVLEYTIGDEPYYPEEVYLDRDDCSCDNIFICVGTGMNVQFANYRVSTIPEPAIFGLLALAALFLRRK